jgi:triacylglycerol esterase/lipase EstA (alpha/beta hydrolase family)
MLDDFMFATVKHQSGNVDVIYIHGLSGHAVDTWSCPDSADESGSFWPLWLGEDVPEANIYTLGYPVGIFAKVGNKEMNIYERAKAVLEYLSTYEIGERPIAIIAHSLGGLLTKQIIQTGITSGNKDWAVIASQVKFVMFLATPHTGSVLADVLKFAFPRISSDHVDLLQPGGMHLDQMNGYYRTHANTNGVQTVAFYEKFQTKNSGWW